ncbi:MAG: translation initiation factor IF-2 [Firmicutes bacterium]|nr:translation initiation factor IF-2 [Bacillota bacterium]
MTQKPTPAAGKLENIKNLKEQLPTVAALLSKCKDARIKLENSLNTLRSTNREIASNREEAVRRAEKQQQYADLIKQREDERRAAEARVDEKAEALRAKQAAKVEESKPVEVARPTEQPTYQRPERPERPQFNREQSPQQQGQYNRDRGGYQGQRQDRPPYGQQRPPYQGQQPRPPYGQQGQGGQRQQNPSRTWTPNQSTGAYGRGISRDGQPGGQGGYQPRPFDPNRPRPHTPGGFGPRPAGPGGARTPLAGIKPTERFVPKENTHAGKKKGKGSSYAGEKTGMDRRSLLRRGIIEEQDIEERMLTRIFRTKKSKENADREPKEKSNIIQITTPMLTVKTLSEKIGKTATEIIKQLIVLGEMCTINSTISFEMAELVAGEFGLVLELHADKTFEEKMSDVHSVDKDEDLKERPPVVTVMGHVDHGKTSLLDALRKTKVTTTESGGITQHIGAYQVSVKAKKITFIDTPGHAAFDKMRARGAKITDVAILIVAADDGVMPQTVEAIKHIQGQDLPMIVAINKIDKKEADIERVKQQLSEHNVIPEEWGGNAIIAPISAVAGTGLDKLLEMILLVAEMNNYKANPNKEASGSIIESRLDKQRGPVVTVLVQNGTLRVGDTLLAGTTYGKVKSMTDENGKALRKATPSTPVQVLGFHEVPNAGDTVYVVDEKLTKQVARERLDKEKIKRAGMLSTTDSEHAFDVMHEAEKTHLNIIVKGDVAGSVEAIIQTLETITSDEVSVHVISHGVGNVNDNDVSLAEVTGAKLVAFHTKITATAKQLAKRQKIQIHEFKVIYEIFDFVTTEMVKLFKPKFIEKYHGRAEVLQLFKSSAIGIIAGCRVTDGKILRNTKIKLLRGGELIGEYKMDSLKIKTNDAKEVGNGHECGIKLVDATVNVGDILESYGQEQLPIMFNGRKYEF